MVDLGVVYSGKENAALWEEMKTLSEVGSYELMADRTRYLKENPEGVSKMCGEIQTFGFIHTY